MNFCNNDERLAGASSIAFYLLSETGNWPLVVTDANAGTITFNPEVHNINGTILPNSIKIKDRPKDTDAGQLWPIDIQFTYIFQGAGMEQLLEQYCNKPGVAIPCFNDGYRKLMGTDQEPLYMTWENDYGDRPVDSAGVIVRIKGDLSQRPVFYNPQ